MINDNNKELIKKIEELDVYLKENNLSVFNIPEDKRNSICGDTIFPRCNLDEIAEYIYKPKDIPENYEPQIRGYIRDSEDWELKKIDVIKGMLAFRRLEADELYCDIKKNNSNNGDLNKLFRELKTGDTLIILDTTHILVDNFEAYFLLSYIENNQMRLIIGGCEYDCRNYDSSKKTEYLHKNAVIGMLMTSQIGERNFYYNVSSKSVKAKEERLFEEWKHKNLKHLDKNKQTY